MPVHIFTETEGVAGMLRTLKVDGLEGPRFGEGGILGREEDTGELVCSHMGAVMNINPNRLYVYD